MTDSERDDLHQEASKLVRDALGSGQRATKSWLVQQICSGHDRIEGPDRDWHRARAFSATDAAVRRAINEFKPSMERDETNQPELPFGCGYKYLQRGYTVERDGDIEVIPVELMTSDERRAKAAVHVRMGNGHLRHAEEILQFDAEQTEQAGVSVSA